MREEERMVRDEESVSGDFQKQEAFMGTGRGTLTDSSSIRGGQVL